jgi:hypothetical protein
MFRVLGRVSDSRLGVEVYHLRWIVYVFEVLYLFCIVHVSEVVFFFIVYVLEGGYPRRQEWRRGMS